METVLETVVEGQGFIHRVKFLISNFSNSFWTKVRQMQKDVLKESRLQIYNILHPFVLEDENLFGIFIEKTHERRHENRPQIC